MSGFSKARMRGLALCFAGALALSACGGREAESDTAVSEAEVETELPETVVSDEQLQATADAAADIAATPPTAVVPVPVESGNMQAPAAGNEMQAQER